MGDYKNVSKFWQFRWKDTDGVYPQVGTGATLYANMRRQPGENHVNFNIVLEFGSGAELLYPDHSNTRFCFRPTDIYMTPTDWCLQHDLTGNQKLRMKSKGGGWWEGPFAGSAEWTWSSKWNQGILVFSVPETAMNKNGKQAFIAWDYPPIWVEDTRIILSGDYEARPLPTSPTSAIVQRLSYLVQRLKSPDLTPQQL